MPVVCISIFVIVHAELICICIYVCTYIRDISPTMHSSSNEAYRQSDTAYVYILPSLLVIFDVSQKFLYLVAICQMMHV